MNLDTFLWTAPLSSTSSSTAEQSHLIDGTTKTQLHHLLQKCHHNRLKIYGWIFNLGVFVSLMTIGGLALYHKRKRKPTPYELYQKDLHMQQYVLSKIKETMAATAPPSLTQDSFSSV